jgi:hypothetical protein
MILIFVMCALSGECREERRPLLAEVTPFQCTLKAQELIAKEIDAWDGWSLSRYACKPRKA